MPLTATFVSASQNAKHQVVRSPSTQPASMLYSYILHKAATYQPWKLVKMSILFSRWTLLDSL